MADKVLVVDDEQEIRELLQRFLTQEGYEVIIASDGEEALELAEKEEPHVILLDVMMLGVDGIKTCQMIKSNEKTRSIPIIMATAFRETAGEAIDAGADDFVTKPFHLAGISIRVKSILRVRHLTDELERVTSYIAELQRNLPQQERE